MSFNKSGRKGNMRKREREADSDEEGGSAVVRVEKEKVKSALGATSASAKKAVPDHAFQSQRTVMPTIGKDTSAVAPSAEEMEEREGGRKAVGTAVGEGEESKFYRGEANRQKLRESKEVMDKKSNSIGPIKAPTNVRMTCRFDYQPDLCKDWKETGYCGFGDACKFMHDRGDYKAGWELERDWNVKQEKLKLEAAARELEGDKEEEDDDGLPFACAICRGPFNSPVETKCMHYFCEGCALAHYTQSKRCFICNEQTHGQFNTAHKLVAKLSKMRGDKEGGHASQAKGDEEEHEGFEAWKKQEERKADIGWLMPGNTFSEGKQI